MTWSGRWPTLKDKGHPIITQLLRDFKGAEAPDERTVVVRFADKRGRDVPLFVAGLPIFSRAYYSKQPFDQSTLEIPLGSGAYKVGRFEVGHFIEFERVKDWWGADLPVARGQNNFDMVRFEYYRDREVGFEGFTAKNYLFREEFTSRTWATRYDFPAFKDGRVKRAVLPDDTPSGAQGWFINTRRAAVQGPPPARGADRRLRFRMDQQEHHVRLLRPHGVGVPEFADDGAGQAGCRRTRAARAVPRQGAGRSVRRALCAAGDRRLRPGPRAGCGAARNCSDDAGFALKNGKRVMPDGKPITIEFLLDEPTFTPHHLPYIKNLGTLGIDATLRVVDPVQYRARVDGFDFDITVERFSFSATPGDSLRSYFSSQAAATKGSQNLAGIADPAVDALVDIIIAAKTRAELTTACRALDRVIRAGRYWIPHWYKASHWIAYWDVFGHPAAKPRYFRGIPETWWYDQDKAAKLERKG